MFDPDSFHERTGLCLPNADALDASAITPAVYDAWRAPRFGESHPELMNNPLWEWLVRTGVSAWSATQRFNGPSPFDAGPSWCFERMGQSVTIMPDGRRIFIAGEHEDGYDPDFHIYNDVVVWHSDGKLDILGYPREVFPPTDFHTATVAEDLIVIIGNLGYPDDRKAGSTQVAVLNLCDMSISLPGTCGDSPGWLHGHKADLSEDGRSILIQGGSIDLLGGDQPDRENLDQWRLWLDEWRWEHVAVCQWQRWVVRRVDLKPLQLWSIGHSLKDYPHMPELEAIVAADREKLQRKGFCLDGELYRSLYLPTIEHEVIPEAEDQSFNVRRILIQDVVVRFLDEFAVIHVTVEGDLPSSVVETLVEQLRSKLQRIQNAPCEARDLHSLGHPMRNEPSNN